MMALVPLGSELERIMGSVRLLFLIILLATSNALFHLLIALVAAYNPFSSYPYLINECAIGFSGILFSMIVIETSLSGVQSRRWVNLDNCVCFKESLSLIFIIFLKDSIFCNCIGLLIIFLVHFAVCLDCLMCLLNGNFPYMPDDYYYLVERLLVSCFT